MFSMKKAFITFCLSISLVFGSFSTGWSIRIGFLDYSPLRHPAPDIKLEDLEEIILEDGLDQYQTTAVVAALFEELADIFKFHVTDSHWIWECKGEGNKNCRHHLGFGISFKAQTKDINNDGIGDVIVELSHPSFCGSGGCYQYILLNRRGGNWEAIGQSRSRYYLSKKNADGKSTFYYADYCMLSPCVYYRLDFE